MNGLAFEKAGGDRVRVSGIDWVTASILSEVPRILAGPRTGPARERLFPQVAPGHVKVNEDWQQFIVPELEHLFVTAGETFARDIQPLAKPAPPQQTRNLTFPLQHSDAWLCAINSARLILGANHEVTEQDMDEREFDDPGSPKSQALLRIHVLGYVMQVLVEFLSGE